MGWKEETAMSNKEKFISEALEENMTFVALCHKFGISRECGYKWLRRYRESGLKGLCELSRKPHICPIKTPISLENRILSIRDKHPAWGGRKIYAYLQQKGIKELPNPSTITRILHRHNKICEEQSLKHTAFKRFEHELPNQLWQMDFKGHFAIGSGRCHPLTILDDHSRYAISLKACANEQKTTVELKLIDIFREYGLPERITMDNGTPWGTSTVEGYSALEVWLILLGIKTSHSRPLHPQTQGKDERFHRTLKEELLNRKHFANLEVTQEAFDEWKQCYNHERPHEACGMNPPASRYQVSTRSYPEKIPLIEYETGSIVKRITRKGYLKFQGGVYYISQTMARLPVKITESARIGIMEVYLKHQKIKELDLINKIAAKKIV